MPTRRFNALRDYLYSLKNRGSRYGVQRMQDLVQALGNPQHSFPLIHVAGTNGKGSVCAMLEAIYRANGYKTGLFTSPHLVHLGERIQVNRQQLSEQQILDYTQQLKPIAAKIAINDPENHPSFFEFMTAMAFLHFAQEQVDIAFIETGLGGRLDSTNVVHPELSIITSIALDHTEILGDTLQKIATEKAGIIKPQRPVIIGKLPPSAEAIIREKATQQGSPLTHIKDLYPNENKLPQPNLQGSHQRWNAALALTASQKLQAKFPTNPHKSQQALQAIHWPGRWQKLQIQNRTLILDATHNAEGAQMLHENLKKLCNHSSQKPIIICGTLGEDRAQSLIQAIASFPKELHLLKPDQPRATDTQTLASHLPQPTKFPVFHKELPDLFDTKNQLTIGNPNDIILVTGSLYLIGELLAKLDPPQHSFQQSLQDLI